MRVTAVELQAIRDVAPQWFGDGCVVRLFGSRLDDGARGGDIDLHVVAATAAAARLPAEIGFTLALQQRIGDQRIDVVVQAPGEPDRPIDQLAKGRGMIL